MHCISRWLEPRAPRQTEEAPRSQMNLKRHESPQRIAWPFRFHCGGRHLPRNLEVSTSQTRRNTVEMSSGVPIQRPQYFGAILQFPSIPMLCEADAESGGDFRVAQGRRETQPSNNAALDRSAGLSSGLHIDTLQIKKPAKMAGFDPNNSLKNRAMRSDRTRSKIESFER